MKTAYIIAVDNTTAKGDSMSYYNDIKQYDVLTAEQEQDIARKITTGDDDAVKELVCSNLRLVLKIANQYKGMGVELEELVSAGNMGLMDAASKFKPGLKTKFGTYAQLYIRGKIKEALSKQSGAIPISKGRYGRIRKIRNASESIGKDASIEEIAEKCQRRCTRKNREIIATALRGNVRVSMQDRVDKDSENTYEDILASSFSLTESIDREEMMALMMESLEALGDDERTVIVGTFGLSGEPKTLMEVGDELRVSAERVRQIRVSALAKMKRHMEEAM